MSEVKHGLSFCAIMQKRAFDLFFSFLGLSFFWWLIAIPSLLAWLDTGENGFFLQDRVGQFGKTFKVIKIRTMKTISDLDTTVTTTNDPRITKLGEFLRKSKIDELPQLINVLLGQMSFVGPRPDVPGFADKLSDTDNIVLSLKPGITGPATLAYRNEAELLATVKNPEDFNRETVFPDKIRINKEYIHNYSLVNDFKYIFLTLFT